MSCTRCRERDAQIHLTELSDGSVTTAHLCPACYAAASGQSVARVQRELRQSSAQFHAVSSRTNGFELHPERVTLKVGEALDLYDLRVHARTRRFALRRLERIGCGIDFKSLDPTVAEWNHEDSTIVGRAPGRTALRITPDRPDRFGNQPTLTVEIEVRAK